MGPPPANGSRSDAPANRDGGLTEAVRDLAERLRDVSAWAATVDLCRPNELHELIGRYLDVLMAHRAAVRIVLSDPTAAPDEPARLVRAAIFTIGHQLARTTGSELESRIRASSALGAVHAVVLDPTDDDPDTVRGVITSAAVAILLS